MFSVQSSCPVDIAEKGYISDVNANICFKVFLLELSIPDAKQYCTEEGGHLLRITNLEQSNVVTNYLGNSNSLRI